MAPKPFVHPYIPNSVPEIRQAMLKEIGVETAEQLYEEIPDRLRFKGRLNLPEPIRSEAGIRSHVQRILSKNKTCTEYLSFLGGGCWQHYVPAVVDEIVNRSEFLTAYCGGNYSDLGKYQARFEFNSLMGELLNMDVVSNPIYDWGSAAGFALRMAARITGRNHILLPETTGPERLAQIQTLCQPEPMPNRIIPVILKVDPKTGRLNLEDLKHKISKKTAAVYFETPSYLGIIEDQGEAISEIAHDCGALSVAGVDPISLGVLTPPGDYGADIACGDLQPLGIHMNGGGGQSGFIAFHEDEAFLSECPLELYTLVETETEGKFAVAEMIAERTSYGSRDKGKDWVATASGLWTIGAAVYLSLMGPDGMQQVGRTIIQNTHYAMNLIKELPGFKIRFDAACFKEFVVNVDGTGKSVRQINSALLEHGIFGGIDLTASFPQLGRSALYCVTEIHTKDDLTMLAQALKEVTE
ncbi:MAG: aminomethyl-transferring glycine dehydrogenase subunit GcvPA [Deltaproteobacteria bacterium]